MKERQQNTTSYPMPFLLVSSTDHVSPVAGANPTVTISKDCATFASPSGSVSEIGNGWYSLAGNATDRNTLGAFLIHATATGADPADDRYTIVPWDPFSATNLGLTNLDAKSSDIKAQSDKIGDANIGLANLKALIDAIPSAQNIWEYSGGRTLSAFDFAVALSTTAREVLVAAIETEIANDATGQAFMQAIADKIAGDWTIADLSVTAIATACRDALLNRTLAGNHDAAGTVGKLLQFLNAAIDSRMAASAYTAPDNANIANIISAINNVTYGLGALQTLLTGINSKTTNLPTNPAAVGSAMSLTPAYDAAKNAGTSNLTAQQVWEYAQRTLSAFGFAVSLSSQSQADLVAALELEMINDQTGQALMQAIANKLATDFNLDDLTISAIAISCCDAILNRTLAGNHDIDGTAGKFLQNADAKTSTRLPSTSYSTPNNAGIDSANAILANATYGLSVLKNRLDGIEAKTINLPNSPAATGDKMDLINAPNSVAVSAIQQGIATSQEVAQAQGILDILFGILEQYGEIYRLKADALANSPVGSVTAPSPREIREEMDANSTKLNFIETAIVSMSPGSGSKRWPYSLTVKDTNIPIADVALCVTTDAEGNNVIASGRTDQNGLAYFNLDPGTYYIWRKKYGVNFENPDVEVVS